jgi:type I restriction enzyme R subunit
MATGSGKTFTAITAIYRLIKFGGAKRVLFLVDRANLGRQTLKEFQTYVTPDDGRAFTELYNVQLLGGPRIDPVARVCIGTIQRLYAMLRGEDLDPEAEEASAFADAGRDRDRDREPLPVPYNPELPPEAFDIVFTDECHRSIYNLWRQVLEYFDASLVGLTATPSKQTFGFFRNNLVMEYGHEQALADGVNVGFDVYRIETAITAGAPGSRPTTTSTSATASPARCAGNSLRPSSSTTRGNWTAAWWPSTRSGRSSAPSATSCRPRSFRGGRRCRRR